MILATFIAYLAMLLLVGIFAYYRSTSDPDDYLLAAREHGTWVSALSASASSESGWVMLGLVGVGYTSGISCFWLLPGCMAGYLFNWLVLGPRLHQFSSRHRCSSVTDILTARFRDTASKRLLAGIRVVAVLLIVIFMGTYAAAQFVATGKALEAMFGWPYMTGVGIGVFFVLLYTSLGGLRAVSWTDVIQAVLMFAALVVVPIGLLIKTNNETGGLIGALRAADPTLLDWWGGTAGMSALGFTIGWLGIGLGYPGQPHVIKRFLSAKSADVFRGAPWIALAWSQIVFAGAITVGLAARIAYPELPDPEQALPVAAMDLLPAVLAGLILAAVFSAISSTADSQLLEAAGAVAHDGLHRWNQTRTTPFPLSETTVNRTAAITIGLLGGIFAMANSPVIFTFVLYSWAALGAGIGTAITFAMLWNRTTALGVLLGLIVGPATVIVWRSALGWNTFLYELVPAFGLSAAAIVVGSLLSRPAAQTSHAEAKLEIS